MSGTVTPAPAGFFQGFQVNEQTAQDLVSATSAALAAAAAATTSAASAQTQATAALTAATAAQSSLASIGTSVTSAATSATNAATSATTAGTSATNAATSATAAGTSATGASTSATTATGAASTATTQAANASSSATAANTSATNAATSASAASTSAASAAATLAGAAPLASPGLTGTPTAPTAAPGTSTTQLATTAFVTTADNLKAPLASPALTGTPTAPTAASGTNSTQLATTAFAAAIGSQAQENVGRNLIHNGEFLIQQRGVGAFTGVGMTADRWQQNAITSTCSTTITALADADRTAVSDEAALWTLKSVVGGTAGAGDFVNFEHKLESVQRYGGKSVTVSFWAKAAAGTPSIGIGAQQFFGSGGSPSASVNVNATAVALSTTWTRYTVTLALPTTIGKTLGTTVGTDYTSLRFWYSAGATNNTIAGGIGVQSPTVSLWGVQAEVGTVATTFEKKSYGDHWTDCLRFYVGQVPAHSITIAASTAVYLSASVSLPVVMRTVPIIAFVSNITGPTNCPNPTGDTATALGFRTLAQSTAAGITAYDSLFSASADL